VFDEDTRAPAKVRDPVVTKPVIPAGSWFPSSATLLAHLGTAGLVAVLTVFMLLERQDLRNRVVGAFGHGHLALTTRALDEAAARVSRYLQRQVRVHLIPLAVPTPSLDAAAARVSRYLQRQVLVNLILGAGVAVGLYLIGVPYPLLWAVLAATLRFIPYVGPWVGAVAPILVSLAVLEGWTRPVLVIGLFVALELFTSLFLEKPLYAGAAGVSKVGLLVAVAFWTWLRSE